MDVNVVDSNKSGHIKSSLHAYEHLLPASYRTTDDDVTIPTLNTTFLKKELGVKRLNDIHEWLWTVGRPMPPRPLHYQKAAGRNIIIHERTDLHLAWDEQRMFLKPIPRYLLDEGFWQDHLNCDNDKCASVPRQYYTMEENKSVKHVAEFHPGNCDRCEIRKLATGFLLSYTSLITYESDLFIAKEHNLVHAEMTWHEWRSLVKSLLSSYPTSSSTHPGFSPRTHAVNPRYHYGELRLDRLNMIYRFTLRAPLRGYLYGFNTYHQFWTANMQRLAAIFVYIIVVLTAMQVGLETKWLTNNATFQRVSYRFTVFSIVTPLVIVGLLGLVFLGVFVTNLVGATRYWRRRMGWIARGTTGLGRDSP